MLRQDLRHTSLHFKRIGRFLVSSEHDADVVWFWIGPHAEYNRLTGGG